MAGHRLCTQRRHAAVRPRVLRAAGEGLGYPELAQLLRRRGVAEAVDRWCDHFQQAGVSAGDLQALSAAIDRPFLRLQRAAWR